MATGGARATRRPALRWSWRRVLRRTVTEFREDNVTDWAAALTYYGVLSIFPALIALISVVGLLGSSATSSLLDNLKAFTPGPAKDILTNAVTGLSRSQSSSGILFVVGLVLALWSASGYVAAFMRAANSIWDAPEAGLVIVGIAGNAVENVAGLVLAHKGHSDIAISVVKNSVSQIAAFLYPVLILASLLFAHRLTFQIAPVYIAALVLTALSMWQISGDGEARTYEGVALIGLYVILAILTFYE